MTESHEWPDPELSDHQARAQLRLQAQEIEKYLERLQRPKTTMNEQRVRDALAKAKTDLDVNEREHRWLRAMDSMEKVHKYERLLEEMLDDPFDELEARFVKNAKAYAERKDISYETWRYFNVPPAVLRDAGITP